MNRFRPNITVSGAGEKKSATWERPAPLVSHHSVRVPLFVPTKALASRLLPPPPPPPPPFPIPVALPTGTLPFAEDTWDEFQVGASDATSPVFRSVKPCSRCKVTTIDQASGEVGQEPLRALGKFRTGGVRARPQPEAAGARALVLLLCSQPGRK